MNNPLYKTVRWQKLRAHQLRNQPWCEMCLKMKCRFPAAATIVDHIVPHRNDKNLFFLGKLQSLCKFHHDSSKKSEEELGYSKEIGPDGWPVDRRHPFYRDAMYNNWGAKGFEDDDFVKRCVIDETDLIA